MFWEGIGGEPDDYGLLNGKYAVLEKKTVTYKVNSPSTHHINQVRYYVVLLRENGYTVDEAYLMYINISAVETYTYLVKIDDYDSIKSEMLTKKTVLLDYINRGELPPRKPGWNCDYCNFALLCFQNLKEIKVMRLEVEQ